MTKRIYKILAISIIFLFGAGLIVSCKSDESHELTDHQKAWIADIDGQMRDTLAKSAGVNEYVTDDERNERLDILINKIETENWNDDQIVFYIRKLISDFHIGHMGFGRSQYYTSEDEFLCYPIVGNWFDDGFYIVATLDRYSDCIGSKIVAINGMSLEDVLTHFDDKYSNETNNYLKDCFEKDNYQGFSKIDFEYLGITDFDVEDVVFTLEKDGRQYEQVASTVSLDGSQNLTYESIYDEVNLLPYGLEIYYKNNQPPFTYEIDKDNRAVYFQYNVCQDASTLGADSGYPYFDEFMEQMILDMKENEGAIDCFILDLRNNAGGSEILWNDAVEKYGDYLNQFSIKVLMGKSTFSAGVGAIDMTLYSFDDVTLYGEETGLAVHNYTEVKTVILENTGCELYITDHEDYNYVLSKRADNTSQGVLPDVEVSQSYESFLSGIDDVYNKAVSREMKK